MSLWARRTKYWDTTWAAVFLEACFTCLFIYLVYLTGTDSCILLRTCCKLISFGTFIKLNLEKNMFASQCSEANSIYSISPLVEGLLWTIKSTMKRWKHDIYTFELVWRKAQYKVDRIWYVWPILKILTQFNRLRSRDNIVFQSEGSCQYDSTGEKQFLK